MCGGGDSASKEAARKEEARLRQVRSSQTAIDRIFNARGPQQQDFVNALRDFFNPDIREQKVEADRQLKFGLARGGLTGGSAAADAGTTLGEEFTKGLLDAEQQASGALADLRADDESSRQSLLALAQTGISSGSAASRALSASQANLEGVRARNLSEGIGNVFGGTADLFRKQQEAAERRRGLKEAEVFSDSFSR